MSEAEQTTTKDFDPTKIKSSDDWYSDFNKTMEKYFENVENYLPKYFQSITELQKEFLQVYENLIKTSLSWQKEFQEKAGIEAKYPEFNQQFVQDFGKFLELSRETRETMTLKFIESFKQFTQIWKNNAEINSDINKNLIKSWASIIKDARALDE